MLGFNVKKFTILLLTLFFFKTSNSYSAENNILLFVKKMQIALDKNDPDLAIEIYETNEDKLSDNWLANERLALAYERKNKYKNSIDIYLTIIKKFNSNENQLILNTKEPLLPSLYQNNKLPFYYNKLAFLYGQLFIQSHKYIPKNEQMEYKKNAENYLMLLKKVNADSNEIKLIEDEFLEKIAKQTLLEYKSNWYFFSDLISWQDAVYLINDTTKGKTTLIGTSIGTSFGFGKKWSNQNNEFNLEGMFAKVTSTLKDNGAGESYLQTSVPETSFIFGPGYYSKTFSEKVLLGIQTPIAYKSGQWDPKSGSTLSKTKQWGAGFFLQVKFYYSKFSFQSRLGKIFPNPGSHWSLGVQYDL